MNQTPVFMRAAIAAVLAVIVSLTSLAKAEEAMMLPVDPAPLVVIPSGGAQFAVEIADDSSERARGLMFRQTMGDRHGMLFVFEAARPVGFWMKNTPMPLDLIFIGEDGVVRAILPGEPFSEAPIGTPEPIRFVLEVKRGIAADAGIDVGDRLSHPAIDAIAGSLK